MGFADRRIQCQHSVEVCKRRTGRRKEKKEKKKSEIGFASGEKKKSTVQTFKSKLVFFERFIRETSSQQRLGVVWLNVQTRRTVLNDSLVVVQLSEAVTTIVVACRFGLQILLRIGASSDGPELNHVRRRIKKREERKNNNNREEDMNSLCISIDCLLNLSDLE
jgi:hypothetical protein